MTAAYMRTRREIYLTIYRFWVRIFALGVVDGIVITFELGLNWSGFAEVALLSTAVGLGSIIYPYIVPATNRFWQALAPNSSVTFLLILCAGCIPIVLIYNAYAYHVFRGKFVVPVPTRLAALAAAPDRSAPRRTPAEDAVVPLPSRLAVKALRLEWLRNVGWIAVWTVLFFLCLNSLGGVLGDVGDLLGVVLLIATMVAVWIVTDRRDVARQTTLGQAAPVEAK